MSLVLLLRQRGRSTAGALARELDVSVRTVLRDIEALSAAGVPVYADRGRHGGFSLLPGFRTELTDLNHDEALALLAAGTQRSEQIFGLDTALASAMRKVVDALPHARQIAATTAASRFLVNPETDLLSRRLRRRDVPDATVAVIRRAVLAGRRLRIHYASRGRPPQWHTVDPIGLVTVRERGYLLATESGRDRTLRMERIHAADELAEAAQRPAEVDLERIWAQRCAEFLSESHIVVRLRVSQERRDQLFDMAEAVRAEETESDGRLRVDVTFQDLWHAEWALWQLGPDAEALTPPELRARLLVRAASVADRYRDAAESDGGSG